MEDTLRIIGKSFVERYDEVMKPIEEGKRMSKKKMDLLYLRGQIMMDFALVFTSASFKIRKEV